MGHLGKSWESFAAVALAAVALADDADAWRRRFMQAAFYAGATAVFDALSDHNDPDNIPRNLELMLGEIRRFGEDGESEGTQD